MVSLSSLAATSVRAADAADPKLVQQGEYVAIAGDCVACHTAPGGKPYAGGLKLDTPVGAIMSTNITPSKTHGIGNYTLEQFAAAVRRGVRADGANLYPAMPYTSYALVSDEDIKALYAYFMNAVEPVDSPAPPTELPFPFNIRLSMAGWNLLFLDNKPFQPDPGKSAEWNRGAYLVNGLTHCSTCHTPRNMMMAEESSRALGGAKLGGWYAPNITSDVNSGIGGWSQQELVDYLRLGSAVDKAQAAGPMDEAVDHSLRHMSESDLQAMATYLKTVPALHDDADTRPPYAWGAAGNDLASVRGVAVPADRNNMTGPQLYDAYCATCHEASGEGVAGRGLPSLFHNTAVGRTNTDNLVMVLLEGVQRGPGTPGLLMPGFAKELSDRQIATLAGYVTQRYGNPEAKVTVQQVSELRSGATSSSLLTLARIGISAVIAVIVLIVAFVGYRLMRRGAAV